MKTILAFGDSNLWGPVMDLADAPYEGAARLGYSDRFSGLLQNMLGDEYRVVEDALPGRTAMMEDPLTPNRQGFRQLEVALEAHAPVDLLILQLGTNELRPMFGMSAEMIACSVDRLVTRARTGENAARKILLIAPHPLHPDFETMQYGFLFGPGGYEKSLGFAKAFANCARNQGVGFLDCGALNFELNPVDGIHYSKRDHRKLAEAACSKVRELIG